MSFKIFKIFGFWILLGGLGVEGREKRFSGFRCFRGVEKTARMSSFVFSGRSLGD